MDLIILVIMLVLIVLIPQTMQIRMNKLCTEEFHHVRIKRLGMFFRVGGGRSAAVDGITVPMLYIQIQGYALGIILAIMGVIWLDFDLARPDVYFLIFIISFFLHLISAFLVSMITLSVGHNRRARREAVLRIKELLKELIRADMHKNVYINAQDVASAWEYEDHEYELSVVRDAKLTAGVNAICLNFRDMLAELGDGAGADSLFAHPMWGQQVCLAEDLLSTV